MRKFAFACFAGWLLAGSLAATAADRTSALDEAYRELVAAQIALEAAKDRREQARVPEPGDRIGIASGKSRLLPQYFEERRAADRAVNAAEQRYQRALERWQRLR